MLAAVVLAFTFLSLVIGIRYATVIIRNKRLVNLELRPNCLLTRSPLVFITGRRSLFYFLNYWNEIPSFLREHGYEVRVWNLPWRNRNSRLQLLSRLLQASPRPVHLIADASCKSEIDKLLLTQRSRLSSVNFAEDITGKTELLHAVGLRSDSDWSIESKYLDHAIELAEAEHS